MNHVCFGQLRWKSEARHGFGHWERIGAADGPCGARVHSPVPRPWWNGERRVCWDSSGSSNDWYVHGIMGYHGIMGMWLKMKLAEYNPLETTMINPWELRWCCGYPIFRYAQMVPETPGVKWYSGMFMGIYQPYYLGYWGCRWIFTMEAASFSAQDVGRRTSLEDLHPSSGGIRWETWRRCWIHGIRRIRTREIWGLGCFNIEFPSSWKGGSNYEKPWKDCQEHEKCFRSAFHCPLEMVIPTTPIFFSKVEPTGFLRTTESLNRLDSWVEWT